MATTELSWEGLRRGVSALCEERGWHHGVPIMSSTDTTRRLILAKGCPMSDTYGHNRPVKMDGKPEVHVCNIDEMNYGPTVVNAWNPSPSTIAVLREKGRYTVARIDTSKDRLNMMIDTMVCQAGAVDSDTELKAMITLKGKINDNQ